MGNIYEPWPITQKYQVVCEIKAVSHAYFYESTFFLHSDQLIYQSMKAWHLVLNLGLTFFAALNNFDIDAKQSIEILTKFFDLTNKHKIVFFNNNAIQLSKHHL